MAAALTAEIAAADAAAKAVEEAVAERWALLRAFVNSPNCPRLLELGPGLLPLVLGPDKTEPR